MEKNLVNPELTKQVKKEMGSGMRIYLIARTFFILLLSMVTPVIAIFLADNRVTKTYFVLGGVILFFTLILFFIFSPKIINKKFQLKKYIIDLRDEIRAWDKRIEHYTSNRAKLLNQDALLIEPYPEITKSLQKTLSEAVKLMQNVSDNYEISLRLLIERYSVLYFYYLNIGQESELHDLMEKVRESLQKDSNERFSAATNFFEACKAEQKKLPSLASAYKVKLIKLHSEEITNCGKEITKIEAKKNQAFLMLENL